MTDGQGQPTNDTPAQESKMNEISLLKRIQVNSKCSTVTKVQDQPLNNIPESESQIDKHKSLPKEKRNQSKF